MTATSSINIIHPAWKQVNRTQVVISRKIPWIILVCILSPWLWWDVFTEQHIPSGAGIRVGSPWTAMVFLSCRIIFPADTCTVTVLMPSRENVHAKLPSRVITGCWGRKTERYRESESHGAPVRDPHHAAVIYTTEVSDTLKHTHTQSCHTLNCVAFSVGANREFLVLQRWLRSVITHVSIYSSDAYKMLILPRFITTRHNWVSLQKAPVVAK